MCSSEDAILFKKIAYHEDLTKFAKLGMWVLMALGAKDLTIEDLIGDIPGLEKKEKDLTQEEKELIELAKQTGLKYKITFQGVKIYS